MKRLQLFLIPLFLFQTGYLAAQDKKILSSRLNEATVFFNGAELTHTAGTVLTAGENEVHIEGLSPQIDINSLKIRATNGVIVSSYEFSTDYLSSGKTQSKAVKVLEDSLTYYKDRLDNVNTDIKININMIDYLQKGISKNISGSEKGLGIDELVKTMDYYKAKSQEMETTQIALNKKKQQYNASIVQIRAQLEQEKLKNNKPSGILKLNLSASRNGNSTFTIAYFTPSASWVPYFDINIASTDKPILFAAKSKVRQTTGMDWEKVKLTLSTAAPSNGKVAPLFSTWFLKQQVIQAKADKQFDLMMQNSYSYDEEVAEMAISETRVQGIGNVQKSSPLIIINGVPATQEEYESLNPDMIKDINILKDASAAAIYGSRASDGVMLITLKSEMDDFVSQSDNALNMVYNIDIPYSIPGNGKVQNIDLHTKEIKATYNYYCAPKLDSETYLLAEVSDWEKLGLLSGQANITYDGTYIGNTYIDAQSTHSKLAFTLGTDKRIAVKREKMQDFSSTKSLGSDIQQVFTYKITVKNNQNKPVKMVLKDQYPVSTQKNIDVTLLTKETTPWTTNKEEMGVITWEEELAPGETKTYQLSYSVKYPKNMRLNL